MRAERLPFLMFVFVLIGLLASLSSCTVADPDLWGHVRFGQDILAAGHVIRSDPYSFTSDQAWTNHEWLAEIIMAGAYRFGGVRGLVALSSGVAALVLLLVGRLLRRTWRWGAGDPRPPRRAVHRHRSTIDSRFDRRLFSVLLFTLMLLILGGAERWTGEAPALARAALRPVGKSPRRLDRRARHPGTLGGRRIGDAASFVEVGHAAVAASIAGSAINPYGWGLWVFLWQRWAWAARTSRSGSRSSCGLPGSSNGSLGAVVVGRRLASQEHVRCAAVHPAGRPRAPRDQGCPTGCFLCSGGGGHARSSVGRPRASPPSAVSTTCIERTPGRGAHRHHGSRDCRPPDPESHSVPAR